MFGGSRKESYYDMLNFLTEAEQNSQNAFINSIINTELKETNSLEGNILLFIQLLLIQNLAIDLRVLF